MGEGSGEKKSAQNDAGIIFLRFPDNFGHFWAKKKFSAGRPPMTVSGHLENFRGSAILHAIEAFLAHQTAGWAIWPTLDGAVSYPRA